MSSSSPPNASRTEDGKDAVKTVFKFADISKVKLNGDAGMSAMNPDPNAKKKKEENELLKFKFEKGSAAKLTIITPPPKGVDGTQENVDETQFEMAKQFMTDMRVRVTLKPDGKITKTNATYSTSDSVTLVDMEMKKIVKDFATFKAFGELGKEKDRKKIAEKVKGFGIMAESKENVTVEFKK